MATKIGRNDPCWCGCGKKYKACHAAFDDKIAKFAGAGTLVPITGFANAVVSPAIEFKPEGYVLGVAAKMFTIAGPVIVYGTLASVIYGIIYWIMQVI